MTDRIRLIVCGFGRVGRALARLLEEKREGIAARHGLRIELAGVGELAGSVYAAEGLPPAALADFFESGQSLGAHPAWGRPGWQGRELIENAEADLLVESTPTNIETGEPALSHIRAALSHRMHVVSANKGPFIRHYPSLKAEVRARDVALKFSAAAAAALPAIDVAETCLAGAEIQGIEGVLNGTTNYILTKMRTEEWAYEEALADAKRLGIAETDPTLDVEGYDTANKLALIANVCMEADLLPEEVDRSGISDITAEQVRGDRSKKKVMRLVGRAARGPDGKVWASVRPESLPREHPLASVEGAEKGIAYITDTMDRVTVTGGKSDPRGAAAALLKDIINIYRAAASPARPESTE